MNLQQVKLSERYTLIYPDTLTGETQTFSPCRNLSMTAPERSPLHGDSRCQTGQNIPWVDCSVRKKDMGHWAHREHPESFVLTIGVPQAHKNCSACTAVSPSFGLFEAHLSARHIRDRFCEAVAVTSNASSFSNPDGEVFCDFHKSIFSLRIIPALRSCRDRASLGYIFFRILFSYN